MGTSGPASAHASSEVNRTTASAGSSSEVGTTVVIVEALCYRKEFKTLAFAAEQRERERERETLGTLNGGLWLSAPGTVLGFYALCITC
jgi:hypothetical protein